MFQGLRLLRALVPRLAVNIPPGNLLDIGNLEPYVRPIYRADIRSNKAQSTLTESVPQQGLHIYTDLCRREQKLARAKDRDHGGSGM